MSRLITWCISSTTTSGCGRAGSASASSLPTEPKKSEPNSRHASTRLPSPSVATSEGRRIGSTRVRPETRAMKSRVASTSPTSTATVMSNTTVSANVDSMIAR